VLESDHGAREAVVNPRLAMFGVALVLAVIAPALPRPAPPAEAGARDFPGWPRSYDGAPLTPLPPGPQDAWFARDFPGRVARFAARDKQVVIRWVDAPTRRLHPASQCFRGAGYSIAERPMRLTPDGDAMSCFAASKDADVLEVCEKIEAASGRAWSDVSSWYWGALMRPDPGGWWSYVVVTRER
jgi:hypothetical protein